MPDVPCPINLGETIHEVPSKRIFHGGQTIRGKCQRKLQHVAMLQQGSAEYLAKLKAGPTV
jgi:hypothetical protein